MWDRQSRPVATYRSLRQGVWQDAADDGMKAIWPPPCAGTQQCGPAQIYTYNYSNWELPWDEAFQVPNYLYICIYGTVHAKVSYRCNYNWGRGSEKGPSAYSFKFSNYFIFKGTPMSSTTSLLRT